MINQSLFPIDKKFLFAISRLEDSNEPNFQIIREKISEVSTMTTEANLHGFPDHRLNYDARHNFMRGFSAALDLIKNIFNNPGQLILELDEQDAFLDAQKKVQNEQEGIIE